MMAFPLAYNRVQPSTLHLVSCNHLEQLMEALVLDLLYSVSLPLPLQPHEHF